MESYPLIRSVRVRAVGATHEGPSRDYNEDAFSFLSDKTSAIALVADGMGGGHTGDIASAIIVAACKDMFTGRATTLLDDLAEVWWLGEHSDGTSSTSITKSTRVRPYTTLPVADRVGLRNHVKALLVNRTPESMGDVSVLEAETNSLLALPERIMTRANGILWRKMETDQQLRGMGAAAAGVIFAGGRASFSWVGDCRVARIRSGLRLIEWLTRDHSLINEYERMDPKPDLTAQEIAELPRNVITRAIGMSDKIELDSGSVSIEKGDVFLVMSDGFYLTFTEQEIADDVRAHGAEAANVLVDKGKVNRPNHSGDNLTAIVVEVLDVASPQQEA